jgi:metallo-beta-lactamase family protein
MIELTCHGAARQVTGSCHLIECANRRVLVDCGLFQGSDAVERENAAGFAFDPASIDFVLLTHAHLDHCGRIPLLTRRGFRGEIIATAPTRELARLVLTDAASLQEEEARQLSRRSHRQGVARAPLYTLEDAFHAMEFFGRRAAYDEAIDLSPGLGVRFFDAGHMLGSASLSVEVTARGASTRMVFSGDIGNPGRPLLRDPVAPPPVDVVVMEATYGDRDHRSMDDSIAELVGAVADRIESGGNVIIPTFALERAQEIIFHLTEAMRSGALPGDLPIFLDSPMAISATEIFARYPAYLGDAARARVAKDEDLFAAPTLRFTRDVADSMALNRIHGGAVILAGSGMCTGGRVRQHLRHNLWRTNAGVIFVGYAAEGTLARRIIDGADSVGLFGDDVRVRAKIWTINGFSAHAGRSDLLAWLRSAAPRRTLLVHGEPERGLGAFASYAGEHGFACEIPREGDSMALA